MFSMLCVFNDHDRVGRAKLGNLDDLSPDSDIFWFPLDGVRWVLLFDAGFNSFGRAPLPSGEKRGFD